MRANQVAAAGRRRLSTALLTATAVGLFSSCSDTTAVTRVPPRHLADISGGNCGASYTLLTDEQDSVMSQYGIPATKDTIAVCETWVGNDYTIQVATVGSSENAVAVPDTVQQAYYSAGTITGFTGSGGAVTDASSSGGSTAFDLVTADDSQVQASYDNPYYGVYDSGGDGSTCVTSINCLSASRSPVSSEATSNAPGNAYGRHGLHRRGVRALVNAMEELPRSRGEPRRFHGTRDGVDVVLSVDSTTELLVGEDYRTPDHRVFHATHLWKQLPGGGSARVRTDVTDEEDVNGHHYVNHSTVWVRGLRINGVDVEHPGTQ